MTIRPTDPSFAAGAQHLRALAPPGATALFDELLRRSVSPTPLPPAVTPAPNEPESPPAPAPPTAEREASSAGREQPHDNDDRPEDSSTRIDAAPPAQPPEPAAAAQPSDEQERASSAAASPGSASAATSGPEDDSAVPSSEPSQDDSAESLAAEVAQAAQISTAVPNGPLNEPARSTSHTAEGGAAAAVASDAQAGGDEKPAAHGPAIVHTAGRTRPAVSAEGAEASLTATSTQSVAGEPAGELLAADAQAAAEQGPLAIDPSERVNYREPAKTSAAANLSAIEPAPAPGVPPVAPPKDTEPQGDSLPRALRKASFAADPTQRTAAAPPATIPATAGAALPADSSESAPAARPLRRRERGALEPAAEAPSSQAKVAELGPVAPAAGGGPLPAASDGRSSTAQLTLASPPSGVAPGAASPSGGTPAAAAPSASGVAAQRLIPRSASHLFTGKGRGETRGPDVDQVRLLQRVARAFEAARERGGEVRIRLNPPELGALKVELQVQDGRLFARVEAETPAARAVLLDNLPALRERLADQGVRLERFDVDLSYRDPSGQSGEQSSPRDPPRRDAVPPPAPLRPRAVAVEPADAAPTSGGRPGDERRVNVIV